MTTVSQRIEELRMKKGLNRPALAAALNLPKVSIEKIETGRLTPSKEQLKVIAEYFGVSVEYLKGESSDPGSAVDWLSGNFPEEELETVQKAVERKAAAHVSKDSNDSVPFSALLKSETFRALVHDTVIEVLNSKEGQQIIAKAVRKEIELQMCIR